MQLTWAPLRAPARLALAVRPRVPLLVASRPALRPSQRKGGALEAPPRGRRAGGRPAAPVAAAGDGALLDGSFVPQGQLLSTRLPADVRSRAEEAIAKRGYRVTVGDVAAAGGLTLAQAEGALKALAADALATLTVRCAWPRAAGAGAGAAGVARLARLLMLGARRARRRQAAGRAWRAPLLLPLLLLKRGKGGDAFWALTEKG